MGDKSTDGFAKAGRCGTRTAPWVDPGAERAAAEFELDDVCCYVFAHDSAALSHLRQTGRASVYYFQLHDRRYALCLPSAIRAVERSDDPLDCMTAREQQIVRLVCMGCVNKQIADRLHISEYTVKTYLKQMFVKLGVHSRSAMVYRCASWGGPRASS